MLGDKSESLRAVSFGLFQGSRGLFVCLAALAQLQYPYPTLPTEIRDIPYLEYGHL